MSRRFDPKHRASGQAGQSSSPSERRITVATVSRAEEDEARASSKYRAALEALFAPKTAAAPPEVAADRSSVKMVTVPNPRAVDPRQAERDKRLAKLLAAEGRAAVSKAADDFLGAGFTLPIEQDVLLKLLDHSSEDRVRDALEALLGLLASEPPKRRAVLEARCRRLEEDAEEPDTRALATSVRRKVLAATAALGSRTGR